MKKLMMTLIICVFGIASMGAIAPKRNYVLITSPKINGLGLDAARTFSITNTHQSGSWDLMIVYISLVDANDSTTALNLSCTASHDNNTTDYTLQDCTTAAGVHTCVNESWTKDPSGISSPKQWPWRVVISGFEDIECTFTDTGGAAADLLTVYIAFATKG